MENNTILTKIGLIQHEVQPLLKENDVSFTNTKYSYANELDVAKYLKPILKKHNLAVVPYKTDEFQFHEKTFSFRQEIRVVDTLTGEYETFYCAFGNHQGSNLSQKIGGALTYGLRYFLLKLFYVPTFDKNDPDYQDELKSQKTPNRSLKKEGVKADELKW